MADQNCPNPLYLAWVKDWLDVARERSSKGVTTYRNAYQSLKACPVVFQHPAELQRLKGFGPKLCDRLLDNLKKHCEENSLPLPVHPQAHRAANAAGIGGESHAGSGEDPGRPRKQPRKVKTYVPALRSGAYALVLALSTKAEDASMPMTKAELIELAQPNCDASFTAPSDTTSFYTAWNSMKTLLTKELVYERGRPLRKYALTDEGWEVATRVRKSYTASIAEEPSCTGDIISGTHISGDSDEERLSHLPPPSRPSHLVSQESQLAGGRMRDTASHHLDQSTFPPAFTPISLPPGSFTVHLLLDVREVRAKTDRDYMQDELSKQGVQPIMRSLELGDAQWIAKVKAPTSISQHLVEGDEIVLDWIVERKRLDDLIGSVKDGRFHEQKFRLKRSGVKKVIYIIEDIVMDPHTYDKYEESVQSAIASTQVVNGCFVKRTQKMDETIRYLAQMTRKLKAAYEKQTLQVIPTAVLTAENYLPLLKDLKVRDPTVNYYITYSAFASMGSKSETMNLRDIFLKMLMTTRGVTGERAIELQRRWPTPYAFIQAFESCGNTESGKKRKRELVSSELSHLFGRKKISKQLSYKIAEIWGDG